MDRFRERRSGYAKTIERMDTCREAAGFIEATLASFPGRSTFHL
jgi:hypothetical protein